MADQTGIPVRKGHADPVNPNWTMPDVDIYETGDRLVLLADIPGVSAPDINVDGNELTIEAKSEYSEPTDATRLSAEFEPRSFRRAFTLPADVDTDGITADVNDGVLRIELPKSEAAKVHKIEVKSG